MFVQKIIKYNDLKKGSKVINSDYELVYSLHKA
jgi:hypothetical protein